MNPVVPSTVALGLPARVKGLDNESLYAVWTTHCLVHQCEPRELLSARLLSRSLFGPPIHLAEAAAEVGKAMDLSRIQLQRLSGADIGGAIDYPSKLLFPSLRYCRPCLEMGYHSIVFQHVAIARCPLHDVQLVDRCPDCGVAIAPTFGSVFLNPFECPLCEAPLSNTVVGKTDLQHARWADQMLGARRCVLAEGVDLTHQGRRLGDLPLHLRSPGTPPASRHYQRVSVWALLRDPQWFSFPEQVHPVGAVHERGALDQGWAQATLLNSAARSVLQWLMQACWAHEKAALRLLGRLGRYPRGLRLNAHTSVVSVALYKLAAAYDLLPEMQLAFQMRESGEADTAIALYSPKQVMRYGDSCREHPQFDARLLQLEMFGLFAKLLIRNRSGSFLDEVSWLDYPHAIEFAPSWRIEKGLNAPVARVRYRAAEVEVERLLKRRWNDVFLFRHHDAVGNDGMWKYNHLDSMWHEMTPHERLIARR